MAEDSGKESPLPQGKSRVVVRNESADLDSMGAKLNREQRSRTLQNLVRAGILATAIGGGTLFALHNKSQAPDVEGAVRDVGGQIDKKLRLMPEQQKALQLYENAKEEEFVNGIQAMGAKDGDRSYQVIYRDSPANRDSQGFRKGNELGVLSFNQIVDKAIVVRGLAPEGVGDVRWLFYRHPVTGEAVFSHVGGFSGDLNAPIKEIPK